ncbi:MAG: hypothetical protein ACOYJE_09330 [Bacteroidaceae bacterium]|jgi:hypothetical protein
MMTTLHTFLPTTVKALGKWSLLAAALGAISLAACDEKSPGFLPDDAAESTVHLRMLTTGEGDDELYDVVAWRFDDSGLLQEALHPTGETADGQLTFVPRERRGTLYFLANSSGWKGAAEAVVPGITREEDLDSLMARSEEMTVRGLLMTGRAELDEATSDVLAVEMQRAVARIDLYTPEENVEVRRVSIRGLYDRGRVFPQPVGTAAEGGADSLHFSRDYGAAPLTVSREVLLYVAEQRSAAGAVVEIEALLNGALHRLSVRLPQELRRNQIYTVQVRGNGASLAASVLYGGWESGDESGSAPRPAAWVDVAASMLGKGVRVSAHCDTVFFPYTGGSWQLALHTRPGATVEVEGRVEGVAVDAAAGTEARLQVDGRLRMPGTSDETLWLNVRETGLYTGRVTLIFDGSPIRLGGMLELDENGICDLGRYVDGELGTVEIPQGKTLTVETAPGEVWMRADVAGVRTDGMRTYRILGGWRPNDPTADGRIQEGRLVIADEADGGNREEYVVRRRNWGLPVVKMGNTWWAKYNLRGDVRRFEDQITAATDPAAERDILDLLEHAPADSLLMMMGDQYQGGIFQGMPLRHDGTAFYHEGMRPSGQNFGLLEPTLMAPDGYQIPAYDDYAWLSANDNQNLGGIGSRTYSNRHGDQLRVTIVEREVHFLGHRYGVVAFYAFDSGDSRWVLFGLGHQWNNTAGNIARMQLLLATHGNPDQTWVMEGYEAADRPGQNWIKFMPQNHIKTRTIRCVKTPVEYIY